MARNTPSPKDLSCPYHYTFYFSTNTLLYLVNTVVLLPLCIKTQYQTILCTMVSYIFSLFLFPFLSHLPMHIWNIRTDRYWQLLHKCQRFQMVLKIFRCRYCWLLGIPPTSTNVEISVHLYLRSTFPCKHLLWVDVACTRCVTALGLGHSPGHQGGTYPKGAAFAASWCWECLQIHPALLLGLSQRALPARSLTNQQSISVRLCCWNRKYKKTSFVGRLGIEAQSQYVEVLANP